MKIKRDLVLEIVESESYQEAIAGPMVDEYVRKLTLPGADGKTSRTFLMDWLYLQRPMFDRFRGARFNVQFEGPAVVIDREEFPIGCMIEREIEWVRIAPDEAAVLRRRLRAAVDEVVTDWIGGRPMKFLPARPQKPFPDRTAADAEAAQIIRDFLGSTGKPEGDG